MWPKLAVATAVMLIQRAAAKGTLVKSYSHSTMTGRPIPHVVNPDCPFTVSVLDVPGVQCVPSTPCSGTYYASGLSQGVGACPTGTSCALLPLTPIMGCAASGRTDLIYVNADGSLTKGGKLVTVTGEPVSTLSPTSTSSESTNSADANSSTNSISRESSINSPKSNISSPKSSNNMSSKDTSSSSESSIAAKTPEGGSSSSNSTLDSGKSANLNSSSNALYSDSGSSSHTLSQDPNASNQQAEFNPGSILSDSSNTYKSSSGSGLGLGSIIAIVVGCLAIVAIAAGARLLKKGKDAESTSPVAAGGLEEAYNDGGGGGGMTPKENVLLL
ncbi:hypothetical protein PsorP6_014355 [Peronosclerospora sorghi]|uniref:Uncharacterized protein n=1 Tax=Peronosclerospora sorghi TaxID=230839 RepID=A0ACC0VG20_9STRA|nr:hypothetical protein PsorP6_014355 [Peronosclerospora sorghi]